MGGNRAPAGASAKGTLARNASSELFCAVPNDGHSARGEACAEVAFYDSRPMKVGDVIDRGLKRTLGHEPLEIRAFGVLRWSNNEPVTWKIGGPRQRYQILTGMNNLSVSHYVEASHCFSYGQVPRSINEGDGFSVGGEEGCGGIGTNGSLTSDAQKTTRRGQACSRLRYARFHRRLNAWCLPVESTERISVKISNNDSASKNFLKGRCDHLLFRVFCCKDDLRVSVGRELNARAL